MSRDELNIFLKRLVTDRQTDGMTVRQTDRRTGKRWRSVHKQEAQNSVFRSVMGISYIPVYDHVLIFNFVFLCT